MKVPIFFHALINQKWFLFFQKQSFPLNKANTASSKLGTFVTQISHLSIVSNDRFMQNLYKRQITKERDSFSQYTKLFVSSFQISCQQLVRKH